MKKGFAGILALALAIMMLLSACGQGGQQDSSTGKQNGAKRIAYYAYGSEPYIDLDPSVEYSNGLIVLHNVYETLTRYDNKTEEVKPLLAESWEVDTKVKCGCLRSRNVSFTTVPT